ncbi:MAG: hypothetical protein R8J84_08625 [Mariprofundales bacterium]
MMVDMGDWSGVLTAVIDVTMVIAMVGLWMLWRNNLQRQHAIEQKLEAASTQLEEASEQLNSVLLLVRDLTDPRPSPQRSPDKYVASAKATPASPTEPVLATGSGAGSQLSRLLCLHREGVEPTQISRRLDMPLAQVKLLLQVHAGDGIKG